VDRIKQMLDTITELTDDQVAELQSEIVAEFETVEGQDPTPQTVETMTSLADMLDNVRGEVKRREAQAEELTARAAEAATRVKGAADAAPAEEETPAEEVTEAPAEEAKEEAEKPMTEASIATEEVSELSTNQEPEATFEAAVEGESEAPVAEAEGEGEMPEPAVEEAPAEPVAETEAPTEAAAEETSIEVETVTADASVDAEATTQEITNAPQEQEGQEAPVTAAAHEEGMDVEVQAPADRRPSIQATETAAVVITAGADIPGYTAGGVIADYNEVARAMEARLHGLRRVKGGDGEQHIVASFQTKYPESRVLNQDTDGNVAKINALVDPRALVASGGHSTPFEVKYDIFGFGTTDRPIRDSLVRFQADRGGIRYIQPPVLSSYANAVGVWTNAVDTNPGTDVKTSLTVAAASELTVATDAVTLQLQFGNLMTRAYPELIARHNELALIQHAREAEQYLASKIAAGSIAVTSTSLIGVARDFLVQIGRASAAYRSRHRLDANMPLRVIAPAWIKDAMRADLALAMPGDNSISASDAEIEGYLAARGVNITFSTDLDVFSAQSPGAMNEFSDTFTWYIFAEGTFLFLDGGTLDVGIIRDSTLVGTNDYKMFVETFEGIAKVGVESLAVTSTISVNGVAAALRDTTGAATAAVIEY
jgi:hypothetical protein